MAEINYQYLAELVQKVQAGDNNAFAELYAVTYKKQYRFAYQYLRDEYLAQDALQELYILVLKNIHKLNEPTLLVAWLNQINFRVCFHMAEKNKRHSAELSDEDFSMLSDPSSSSNPEKVVGDEEERAMLLEEIRKLPPLESEVIILRYYHNMKIDDIAVAMDCSRSSVKRYLQKGRDRLKRVLESRERRPRRT